MMVVDTSILIAIVLNETAADRCMAALETDEPLLISAGTLTEAMIVAVQRDVLKDLIVLVEGLKLEVVSVNAASARRMADAYRRWGKGQNAAGLNFGDCFAYEVAKERNVPLLYIGNDFTKTDIQSVL
jgi:ribonuclease VapC